MASSTQNPPSNFAHLHYGGSANTRTGRFGPKPEAGRMFKVQKRLELMVRLENAGIGEAATAAMLCISVSRLRYIKRSPEYLTARIKITHGIIIDHDKNLAQIKEQRKEILTQMLPPALQVIANELAAPAVTLAERKHKFAVAQDVMDREGLFAKVSKTEIKPVDHFDFEEADKASAAAISAIKSIAAPPVKGILEAGPDSTHSEEAVEANEAFSNSHTLSATDQERALAKLEEEAALLEMNIQGPVN